MELKKSISIFYTINNVSGYIKEKMAAVLAKALPATEALLPVAAVVTKDPEVTKIAPEVVAAVTEGGPAAAGNKSGILSSAMKGLVKAPFSMMEAGIKSAKNAKFNYEDRNERKAEESFETAQRDFNRLEAAKIAEKLVENIGAILKQSILDLLKTSNLNTVINEVVKSPQIKRVYLKTIKKAVEDQIIQFFGNLEDQETIHTLWYTFYNQPSVQKKMLFIIQSPDNQTKESNTHFSLLVQYFKTQKNESLMKGGGGIENDENFKLNFQSYILSLVYKMIQQSMESTIKNTVGEAFKVEANTHHMPTLIKTLNEIITSTSKENILNPGNRDELLLLVFKMFILFINERKGEHIEDLKLKINNDINLLIDKGRVGGGQRTLRFRNRRKITRRKQISKTQRLAKRNRKRRSLATCKKKRLLY